MAKVYDQVAATAAHVGLTYHALAVRGLAEARPRPVPKTSAGA